MKSFLSSTHAGPAFKTCLTLLLVSLKALFGDVNTHQNSVVPQAESYVHRFGPGLILYWFGHAPLEMLDDAHGDIVISAWKLPEPMLFPTGELAMQQNGDRETT
jgi:hypothetical protein